MFVELITRIDIICTVIYGNNILLKLLAGNNVYLWHVVQHDAQILPLIK